MRLHVPISAIRLLVGVALLPVLGLWLFGGVMVMPPLWVHFYGVGVSALVAAAAALVLMTIGARRGDARTVVIAGGFTIMAALLAVHGLVTPGVLVGNNGVVALTGAATLPVGAAVLALSTLAVVNERRSIPLLLGLVAAIVAIILVVSLVGVLVPRLVPSVPDARSLAAWTLLAVGLLLFGALAIRAANTFLLTRRIADLAVVVGLVLLACSLFGALALTFMDLGWWVGHLFELIGIALVGASVAYDLRRGSQSRPLVGDLRASEVVYAEEAFLGARVRAIMVRLGEKDSSTEEHTRRVAALAVEVGEALGLSGARLRNLAIGGLLHDVGQALGSELDPAEAGPARRRGVRGHQAASPTGTGAPDRTGGLRRAGGPPRSRSPRAARRQRLPARSEWRRSSISKRGSSRFAMSTTPSSRRGSTVVRGRMPGPSLCFRRNPGSRSIQGAWRRSSASCRARTGCAGGLARAPGGADARARVRRVALDSTDERHLLRTIDLAASARAAGNHPFGSLIVDASGEATIEAENTVVTGRDVTGHAELNVVRAAGIELGEASLRGATLYTSTEPCAMCAGAIYWSGITAGRLRARERDVGGNRGAASGGFDLAAPVPGGLRTGWAPRGCEWPASPRTGNRRARRLLGVRSRSRRARTRRAASSHARSTPDTSRARRRPHRPPREVAATVRAASSERVLRAVDTERALEGADPRELALGRQVAVAALAVRAELEHRRKSNATKGSSAGTGSRGTAGSREMLEDRALLELQAIRR